MPKRAGPKNEITSGPRCNCVALKKCRSCCPSLKTPWLGLSQALSVVQCFYSQQTSRVQPPNPAKCGRFNQTVGRSAVGSISDHSFVTNEMSMARQKIPGLSGGLKQTARVGWCSQSSSKDRIAARREENRKKERRGQDRKSDCRRRGVASVSQEMRRPVSAGDRGGPGRLHANRRACVSEEELGRPRGS